MMETNRLPFRDVLFEPWSLGDALVAAATAREDAERFALVCDERWVNLIASSLPAQSNLRIYGIHLPYTMRQTAKKFALPDDLHISSDISRARTVFNIRGDFRDRRAARKLFPDAKLQQSGWYTFFARKSAVVDLPVALGVLPIRNRYKAWADLTGTPFRAIEKRYSEKIASVGPTVVIHIGAQWRSKRYPHVEKLVAELRRLNIETMVVRGPGDPLIPGLNIEVPELTGDSLVQCFRGAGVVIANDSGPMHLAAFLGCRTICLGGVSNLTEWQSPSICALVSPEMPKGYRPLPNYMSDQTLSTWPSPDVIATNVVSMLSTIPAA